MKPILTFAAVAALALTGQSVYAEHDRGGYAGNGRAAVSRSAPAAVSRTAPAAVSRPSMAPQASMRASAPRAQVRSQAVAPQRIAPQRSTVATSPTIRSGGSTVTRTPQRSAVVAQDRAGTRTFAPGTTTTRARGERLRDNSIAFGGSRTRTDAVRSRGFYRPPVDVYRDWDRGRIYSWHNHRYHWYDGAWVALDVGPDYYSDYDIAPSVAVETTVNGDLVAQVQAALDRRGYNAGPADGVIGPQTRDAISAFQDDHGLAVNGEITNSLIRNLGL